MVGNSLILSPRQAPDFEIFLNNIYANFFMEMGKSLTDTLEDSPEKPTFDVEGGRQIIPSYFMSLPCGLLPTRTDRLSQETHIVWHYNLETIVAALLNISVYL